MKRIIRILSVLLIVCIIVSSLCVSASAAEEDLVRQYGNEEGSGFLLLGDSFGAGYGASDTWSDELSNPQNYGVRWKRWINGSYAALVAEAVGCTAPMDLNSEGNYWPCAMAGQTLACIMDLMGVDDGYTDTELYHNTSTNFPNRYQKILNYYGDVNASYCDGYTLEQNGEVGSINDLAAKADLIVVELGMCDVFFRAFNLAMTDAAAAGTDDDQLLIGVAESSLKYMYEGLNQWGKSYPLLIEHLQALNPDATIVTVSTCNLIFNATLNGESVMPVGSAVSMITASMNTLIKQWSEQYGTIYVDISNVDVGSVQYDYSIAEDFLSNLYAMTHPTPEGHAQIARMILAALPREDGGSDTVRRTDIQVDLGRFDAVDYVLVDGKPVTDYTMENYVLTIPYALVSATNLTIAVKQNGKLVITTYQLSYHDGYSAYRIYTTNDAVQTATKLTRSFIKTIKTQRDRMIDLLNSR